MLERWFLGMHRRQEVSPTIRPPGKSPQIRPTRGKIIEKHLQATLEQGRPDDLKVRRNEYLQAADQVIKNQGDSSTGRQTKKRIKRIRQMESQLPEG